MRLPRLAAAAFAAALLAVPAAADETTFCNQFITSLPYTITVQGHYCFNRNLSTPINTGAAITINADYVYLDLNNFKLGGGAAGPATNAIGVYSSNRSNITVRGGNIRGFAFGIALEGTNEYTANNLLVEKNVVDGNYKAGIVVAGRNGVVRDNLVLNTGGSPAPWWSGTVTGITNIPTWFSGAPDPQGNGLDVIGNVVAGVEGDSRAVSGIFLRSWSQSTVTGNTIRRLTGFTLGTHRAVWSELTPAVCRDNVLADTPGGTYQGCVGPAGAPNYP
jgi:parallel beta-helix repeat protein/putative cofactor-binding repeat protein